MDSRINIRVGVTAAPKWDVSVFVLSTVRPCDWGDLAGVGATAAPPLVLGVHAVKRRRYTVHLYGVKSHPAQLGTGTRRHAA